MIILKVWCGMGNQMFEYAYARMLQEQYKEDIVFDLTDISDYNNHLALDKLSLAQDIKECPPTLCKIVRIKAEIMEKIIRKCLRKRLTNENYFRIASKLGYYHNLMTYIDYPFVKSAAPIKYVNGVFESPRWFESVSEQIKEEFLVKIPPSEKNRKKIEEISSCNSVCVHVRLGDYVNDPYWAHLNICNEKYYQRSMEYICSQIEDPQFYVFSNDRDSIQWIKNNWVFPVPVHYVELDNPDYEELRLMYTCKYFIVANSTFSWWAQYLCRNPEKIVCAPDQWNRLEDASYIYQPGWIIIHTEESQ